MITKNIYYTNKKALQKFIQNNTFADKSSLLIQVFSSELKKDILQDLLKELTTLLPQAKIIGATTDGEILDNVVSIDKIILSFTLFEKATLKVAYEKNRDDSFSCGVNLAKKLLEDDSKLFFLFSDGLHSNGEVFLNGIKSIAKETALCGGMAGDAALFKTTYIFAQEKIISNGSVGVSVNTDRLNIKTSYSFDWQEIGKEFTVTVAKDNRVYKLDDKTAVETYAHYLGQEIASSLPAVGIEFPLIITRGDMKIARAVLGKEEDGSLIFAGNLNIGDKVRFGYGNRNLILKEATKTQEYFSSCRPESIFVYSCMARRRFLEESIATELTPLAMLAPTSGFFTYGEFYKSESCELLNQTMTVIALSEEMPEQSSYKFDNTLLKENFVEESITQKALSHLIETTSKELQETNENLESLVQEKTSALRNKIVELEEASKAKSDFLAGMSHEIRTPLNAILGFIDILQSDEKDPLRLEHFNIIKNSGISLLTIINDILDFSKIESGKMTLEKHKFHLIEPFMELHHLFYEQAKSKDIHTELLYSDEFPEFFIGDIVRIKQVVSNFYSNAIKFTPNNGSIIATLSFDKDKNELSFKIKDSGVGIGEKNLNKIFESFTQEDNTTTRKFGGTGLGLTISKTLINSMGGEIGVSSVLGEGSEFYFTLPLPMADNVALVLGDKVPEIDIEMPLEGKVLVVEDNKTNQMLINILLDDVELDVEIAENGLVAVEMFKNGEYNLILMDENMPEMNGIEATKIILEYEKEHKLQHTPIVALTANALATDRARFLAAGMDEFVSKPIDNETLVRVLQKFLLP